MKKFEEEVEKPRTTSLRPLSYKDVLLKEFSRVVQENYTKNAQILREHREYIEYLEQELEKSRDLEGQANNQASYEYILKCEAETLLKEKQEQIVALKSQLDSQQSNLPEIPQFVAKWLDKKPLYAINGPIPIEIIEWSQKQTGYADLGRNINHLLKLKVNGYTVAKKKLYKVVFPKSHSVLCKTGEVVSFAETVYEKHLLENAMTESEIKAIDERYWQFAVPVEEK